MLKFQGIEITRENYHFLGEHAGRMSDIYLQATIELNMGAGSVRAAKALLTVEESGRSRVQSEGAVMSNVTGIRYADGVERAATLYNQGVRDFKYTQANLDMLARESAQRDRTGVYKTESFNAAFASLPRHGHM